MQSVSDESIERALNFMRDSSKPLADAKARMKYLEQKRKTLKAVAFLDATGSNIAEREAKAYTAPEYRECLEEYRQAVYDAELLTNEFRAAELRIEVWRSLNANSRRGHV